MFVCLTIGHTARAEHAEEEAAESVTGSLQTLGEKARSALGMRDDPEAPERQSRSTADNRQNARLTPMLVPFSIGTWVPSKRGATLGLILDRHWTIEPEYFQGELALKFQHINFVEFSERLLLLNARWYPNTNSLNVRGGLGQRRYRLTLGDEALSRLAPHAAGPAARLLEIENYVLALALGNRWQLDGGFTFGVDWAELFVPITSGDADAPFLDAVSDDNDRRNAKTAVNVLRYAPTFTFLKLYMGWSF